MPIHKSLLVLPVALLAIGGTITANGKSKHYISKITHIKVTPKRVYGHTTRGANVTALRGKKSLGHAMANKKGNFTIKTKKNLKKVTFKLKAAKKGYVSRTTTYKIKVAKVKATTKAAKANKANVPVPVPTPTSTPKPAVNKTSKDNSDNKAQQLQAAKDRVTQAQSNYNLADDAYSKVNGPIAILESEIEWRQDAMNDSFYMKNQTPDGIQKFLNTIHEDQAKLDILKPQLPALRAALEQATQELNSAKDALSALK